LFWSQTGES
jgi:hypothetical protein